MNLDNIRVEIRPRSSLEAIDLGFAMARQWFLPLWLLWIAVVLPLGLISHLIFFEHLSVISALIWWLKPVYERPLVFWLSRALFNEQPGYKEIAKQYFKIIKPRLFADLTYLRLSPNRSFFMPITILENLNRKEHSSRAKVLGHNQSTGIGLTFVSIIFEIILTFSILMAIFFAMPEEFRFSSLYDFIFGQEKTIVLLGSFVSFFAMSIIAPFYVAAGFSLYINRRTRLEAWDIEISFKRLMARKAEKRKSYVKGMSTVICLAFLVTICFMTFTYSANADSTNISKKEASVIINKVLEHDDFGKKKTETAWKLREFGKVDYELPQWFKNLLDFFRRNFKWIQTIPKASGIIFEILAWALGGIIFVFILYKIMQNRQWFQYSIKTPHKRNTAPSMLFGLDLSEKSLPDDIIDKVTKLLKNNEIRKALSLLYRGALVRLINDFDIQIPSSATENECIKLVKLKAKKREINFFQNLTKIWLAMAYGHIIPERQMLEQVCQTWQAIYG